MKTRKNKKPYNYTEKQKRRAYTLNNRQYTYGGNRCCCWYCISNKKKIIALRDKSYKKIILEMKIKFA